MRANIQPYRLYVVKVAGDLAARPRLDSRSTRRGLRDGPSPIGDDGAVPSPRKPVDVPALARDVRGGDRAALSRAITLVESTRPDHRLATRELMAELGGDRGRPAGAPRRHLRGARRRQVHLHRVPGQPPAGRRAADRGPRGRPLVGAHRRLGAGRQDPHGDARGRPPGVRAALALRGHPRRRRQGDGPGDGRARGGRLRPGPRRDRRGGAVGGDGGRDGRHLPVPHPRPHRRPAPGHQEGHPRDRRRHRGQQGRRPRGRDPRRRQGAGRRAPLRPPGRAGVGAAGADLLGPHRRRRAGGLGEGAGPPGLAGGVRAARQAGPAAARLHLVAGPRRAGAAPAHARRGCVPCARRSTTRCGPGACPPPPPPSGCWRPSTRTRGPADPAGH